MGFRSCAAAMLAAVAALGAAPAQALDEVTFGTNWLAQAEHGGFYQAVADGTYEKHGLKVTIRQGGPQAANRALLTAGKIQFYMGGNLLEGFSAVEQGVPTVVVAAIFQKEPQVLIAHPGQGFETFEDLTRAKLFLSKDGVVSFFQWMKSAYPGFRDAQVRPYAFNAGPFLADTRSAMQGYVTSEPYEIERQAGFKPKTFLIADYGFDAYSTTIETQAALIDQKPDLVKRFVEASALGWAAYLHGDPREANALIRKDNPEMTDGQLAFSIAAMKEFGLVDGGDAATLGIGAIRPERIRSFYDKMVKAGVVKPDLDIARAFTTAFVNRGVGAPAK